MQDRRDFLTKSLLGIGGLSALSSCDTNIEDKKTINVITNKKYEWLMTTTWSPKFPVLGEGLDMLSNWVKIASGGRMHIKVMGAGELIPALECFDAVSQGAVHLASSVSYYWGGKVPASQFFASLPFGMNAQQVNSWIINGGGQALWEETYAPHNLYPLPAGNTGVQMGGWFRKEINTIADIQGLKMRIPGLGGKVWTKAGGVAVLSPGSELYTNLERGVIDATEWIGPYHDYKMGFYSVAKHYYYPGWHEPGPILEMIANKQKWEALPLDLQEIIKNAIYRLNSWTLGEFEAKNNLYLKKLVEEEGVKVKPFSNEILKTLFEKSKEVIQELTEKDALCQKINTSYQNFRKNISAWSDISEKFYNNLNF